MESIYEFVLQRLIATKGSWPVVAKASGVPVQTIHRIASGATPNPGVQQIEKLAAYFRRRRRAA